MRALFVRGAFTAADALGGRPTLAAYAVGLLPFVLIRSAVATFFARGDTATPVKAALFAAAVNIAFKVLLMGPLAQVGLALATSIGAWINLGLVVWFARARRHISQFDAAAAAIGGRFGRRRAGAWRRCYGCATSPVARLVRGPGRDLATSRALATLAPSAGRFYGGLFMRCSAAAGSRHFGERRTLNCRPSAGCRTPQVDIAWPDRYGTGAQ